MKQVNLKTKQEIKIMREGGLILKEIKDKLVAKVAVGVNAMEIENLASGLIKKTPGGQASFKMVPGYKWVTCININEGLVHGIPKETTVFKKGDLVSIDVGLFYKGFHTDTSTTILVGSDKQKQKFLNIGKTALKVAINQAKVGNKIFDISKTIEEVLVRAGTSPIRALTGHGVGRNLHEEPYIPCFTSGSGTNSPKIEEGMALAIEIMYAKGNPEVIVADDGWTIATQDGKISALFEETVAIDSHGPFVLTELSSVDTALSAVTG